MFLDFVSDRSSVYPFLPLPGTQAARRRVAVNAHVSRWHLMFFLLRDHEPSKNSFHNEWCGCLQACREGNFLATTKLLALGADVNRSSNGSISEPPLHAAITAGAPDLVNLLIRHGAQPTESIQGDTASLAAELLLQEAVDAGLCLPEDLCCASSSDILAAGNAHKEAAVLRSIRVLSWVEGEICRLSGGPPCGCCCTGEDFLQAAAGVPPVASLIWPFEDPLEVRRLCSSYCRLQRRCCSSRCTVGSARLLPHSKLGVAVCATGCAGSAHCTSYRSYNALAHASMGHATTAADAAVASSALQRQAPPIFPLSAPLICTSLASSNYCVNYEPPNLGCT